MCGGAAWGMLVGKGGLGLWCNLQVTLCEPYLSALDAFAKTRYTNRRYLYTFSFTIIWLAENTHQPTYTSVTIN